MKMDRKQTTNGWDPSGTCDHRLSHLVFGKNFFPISTTGSPSSRPAHGRNITKMLVTSGIQLECLETTHNHHHHPIICMSKEIATMHNYFNGQAPCPTSQDLQGQSMLSLKPHDPCHEPDTTPLVLQSSLASQHRMKSLRNLR